MTIELSRQVEQQLRDIASEQGRDVPALIEEAVRLYLEAASVTDVTEGDVAATQLVLAREIADVSPWDGERP